jgi:EmrB/QacA subfamily drug resistance transporter
VLVVVCAAVFIGNIDGTIMNVALPSLARDLTATGTDLQWVVDSFVVVFAGLLFAFGTLADRYGRRRFLIAGLAVFGLASGVGAFSSTVQQLIAARAVTGIGAAMLFPATLAILAATFTEPAARAKAIGAWGGAAGLAVAAGPIVGGWLLEHFWWGSVLLVNVPICLVVIVATVVWVPESSDDQHRELDIGGVVLSIMAIVALVFTIIEAPNAGWTSARTLVGALVAATLGAAFVHWELRHPEPMLDVRLFRNGQLSRATLAVTAAFFSLVGTLFAITQYLQLVRGLSTLQAGVRVLPIAVSIGIGSGAAPKLAARFGSTRIVAAGAGLLAGGLLALRAVDIDSPYLGMAAALALIGLGVAATTVPATGLIMDAVPSAKAGVGSAINDTTRELGAGLGVAVLGSVLTSVYRSDLAGRLDPALGTDVIETARSSLAAALVTGNPTVATAARDSFVVALHTSATVAAIVMTVVAVLVAVANHRATATRQPSRVRKNA